MIPTDPLDALDLASTRIDSLSDATREFLGMGITATQLANFTGQSLEFQKEFVIKIGGNPLMFEVTRQQGDHPVVALRKALLVGK